MISANEVKHVAHLARIELTPEEEQKFAEDLSAILQFVEKLNEVDTTGIEPMTGGTTKENAIRADEQIDKSLEGKTNDLMEAVPEKTGEWVKVKTVFE